MNTASDFEYFPSPSPICIQQQQLLPALLPPPPSSDAASGFQIPRFHQKPRKKRSKVIRVDRPVASDDPCFPRPKPARKPDPSAPKITRPCTECGKKFWSWKALFGHMRCHPERQWRGINPPANLHRSVPRETAPSGEAAALTEEDQEVAASLLMLANGPSAHDSSAAGKPAQGFPDRPGPFLGDETAGTGDGSGASGRFECSSCKKVFGSHQALGGHRASHKNVKGCFAITRNEDDEDEDCGEILLGLGEEPGGGGAGPGQHKCIICMKIFSSGQALGGHKRRHWEKGGEEDHHQSLTLLAQLGSQDHNNALLSPREGCCGLDLNMPAPSTEETSSSSYSSGLALDLRLGI